MTQYDSTAPSQAHQALRHHVVTAVLVSHDGSRWLPTVLEALLGQQRPVQRIVAVDTGSRDDSVRILQDALGADNVLERRRSVGYGAAVAFGLKSSAPVGYDEFGYDSRDTPVEWIWLLHDDSEPAPDALGQLLLSAEDEPDAVVLGPKIRGWYDKRQLMEVGATVAANGRRWTGLERNEHDQGQHDEPRPVLSVSSAGMLVRRDIWDRLRGFDRSISLFREDLDFCWRVNSAGYQVRVAPDAVVYHAEASARERRRIGAGPNRPHLLDRTHALYTVAVNRPSRFWPALWLRLIVGTFFRALGYLVGKAPGMASDEFFALLGFMARPDRVLRGRAVRRKQRTSDPDGENHRRVAELFPPRGALSRNAFDTIWGQLRGNREESQEAVSRRHRSAAETGPVSEDAETLEADSAGLVARILRNPVIAVGGGLTVVALIAARSILFGGTLAGGALLPTPVGASDLWSTYLSGWHDLGLGATSASPPYLAIVAMLATVLFGKASWAVSVLLIGSVPLAGLSASYALRRVTSVAALRIWGGYAYALLAVATGAIATGRLGTAVAMATLPVIVTTAADAIGGPGRAGSTRAAWTCAFLLTIGTAFAPVSWVLAAAFGALSALTVAWRTRSNIVVVLIRIGIMLGTPIVVLAPWSLTLLEHPTAFFIEIGLSGTGLATPAPTPLGLLLGNPGGPGVTPVWFGAGLLLAALAALLRGTRRRIVIAAWSMALVGYGSAVVIAGLKVTPPGAAAAVLPWPGLSTAMLGLGLITATVVGAEGAKERIANAAFGWRQPLTVLITGAAVLAPVAAGSWWIVRGAQGPVTRVAADLLPAYVAAEGDSAAQPRTLLLTERADGSIGYSVVSGSGPTLGDADIRPPASQTAQVDQVVGELLSGNGGNALQQLSSMGIGYVLVASDLPANLQRNLDGVSGLTERSVTQSSGQSYDLWSVNGTVGRLTLIDAGGNALPVSYQCGGSSPSGTALVCAQDVGASVVVPSGKADRLLVLAEQAVSGWQASIGGHALPVATTPGGMQAWTLPAGGGTVTVAYHSIKRDSWLIAEGVAAAAATIMALPFGRRPEEEDAEGEEAEEDAEAAGGPSGDDAAEPRGSRGRRPDTEPEREPEPEPEPEPEYASAYDARVRAQSGYESNEAFEEEQYEYEAEPTYGFAEQQRQFEAPRYEDQAAQHQDAAYQEAAYEEAVYQDPQQHQDVQYDEQPYQTGQYQTQPYQAAEPAYQEQSYDTGQYQQQPYPYAETPQYQQSEYQQEYPPQEYQQYEQFGAAETTPQTADPQYAATDYSQFGYDVDPYGNLVAPVPEQRNGHETGQYEAEPYTTGQYETGTYPTGQYEAEPYTTGQYGYPTEQETDGYGHSEQDGWTR